MLKMPTVDEQGFETQNHTRSPPRQMLWCFGGRDAAGTEEGKMAEASKTESVYRPWCAEEKDRAYLRASPLDEG